MKQAARVGTAVIVIPLLPSKSSLRVDVRGRRYHGNEHC